MKKIILIIITSSVAFNLVVGQVMFGKVDNNKVLKFQSNYITFSKPIEVRVLGKKVKSHPSPLTINGDIIYNSTDIKIKKKPVFRGNGNFSNYIFNAIRESLEELPDGHYTLNRFNLVVDKYGKLAYFDFDTLQVTDGDFATFNGKTGNIPRGATAASFQELINNMGLNDPSRIQKANAVEKNDHLPQILKLRIYNSLFKALAKCPPFTPAKIEGKTVNFFLSPERYCIGDVYIIKNGKASLLTLFK